MEQALKELKSIQNDLHAVAKEIKRSKLVTRTLAISLALDLLLTAGMGFGFLKLSDLGGRNREAIHFACVESNKIRTAERDLWKHILEISPSRSTTPLKVLEEFRSRVNSTFAPLDCER